MRVLFVCTGNTCRSPLAAALAGRLYPAWEVRSAGLQADASSPMSDGAQEALARRGLDGSTHRSTPLTRELIEWADRVLVMTEAHERRLQALFGPLEGQLLGRLSQADVSDPFMGTSEDYEACAEAIEAALEDF